MDESTNTQNIPLNFKKTVFHVMRKKLKEIGFIYDEEKSFQGIIYFSKEINTTRFRLMLKKMRWANKFVVLIGIPNIGDVYMYHYIDNSNREFEYNSEEELINCLNIVLEDFLLKGRKFLNEHEYSSFDAIGMYERYVDPFLDSFSFKREIMSDNFNKGGYVLYSKGNVKIYFFQWPETSYIKCEIHDDNGKKTLNEMAIEQKIGSKIQDNFLNGDEFRKLLILNLEVLKKCYLEKVDSKVVS